MQETTDPRARHEIPIDVALAHTRYYDGAPAPTAAARAVQAAKGEDTSGLTGLDDQPAAKKTKTAKPDAKPDIGVVALDGPDGAPFMFRGRVRLALAQANPKRPQDVWTLGATKADEWMNATRDVLDIDELMEMARVFVTFEAIMGDLSTFPSLRVHRDAPPEDDLRAARGAAEAADAAALDPTVIMGEDDDEPNDDDDDD